MLKSYLDKLRLLKGYIYLHRLILSFTANIELFVC
jgi:hypothetical protein